MAFVHVTRDSGDYLRCLVVVAHPDDESIWMGGLMLRHKDWEWHVLSLCRADDADREPRFHRAARELGVREHISDLDDSPILAPLSPDLREIKERIHDLVPADFDLIFSHGPAGEYAYHLRHAEVSRAISEMIADGDLSGRLVVFAYEDGGRAYMPRPSRDAQIRIELTKDELARKQQILRDIYGFPAGTLEFDSAGSVEAFSVPDTGVLPEITSTLSERSLSGRRTL